MAARFDGTDDQLHVADSASLTPAGSISCGAWVNADSWRTTLNLTNGIMSKHMDNNKSWGLAVRGNGVGAFLYFGCAATLTGSTIAANGTTNIAARTSEWLHIAAVYVPSTSITVYLNGIADGNNTTSIPAAVADNTATLAVGTHWLRTTGFNHDGLIADAWMINAALTPAQMAEIVSAKRLPIRYFNSNLKVYLPLMGPTGAAVATSAWGTKDLSGNGNSVSSVVSAPVWTDDPLPPQSWTEGLFGGAWTPEEVGGRFPARGRRLSYMAGPRMIHAGGT